MNSRINEAMVNGTATDEAGMHDAVAKGATEKRSDVAGAPWTPVATRAATPRRESPAIWQTPGYTVIDTALEVTAYALTTR